MRKPCSFVIQSTLEGKALSDESTLTLSIGAVSKATGIPANTLRTWERRYGFPKPLRTDGGQRAYAASVVPHLTEVARALERGLRPRDVLTADLDDLKRWSGSDLPVVGNTSTAPMIAAVRALDAEALDRLLQVNWAHRGGIAFLDDVAGPFLAEVGDLWANGKLEVFQEHFASEILRTFLARNWRPLADHAHAGIVVVAAPPSERHDLGLHFVACTLALCGRRVGFLGTNTPIDDIIAAASQCDAEAVACSFSLSSVGQSHDEVVLLAKGLGDTPLIVGGTGSPLVEGTVRLTSCAALQEWVLNKG